VDPILAQADFLGWHGGIYAIGGIAVPPVPATSGRGVFVLTIALGILGSSLLVRRRWVGGVAELRQGSADVA
jgi:hypothetical protein